MFPAEDYDLWCRLLKRTRFKNLGSVLYSYRLHPAQVTADRLGTNARADELRVRMLTEGFPTVSPREVQLHCDLCSGRLTVEAGNFARSRAWLSRLRASTCSDDLEIPDEVWTAVIAERWLECCRHFLQLSGTIRNYFTSPLRSGAVAYRRELRFVLDSWRIRRCT
jgi:hypothetical protein